MKLIPWPRPRSSNLLEDWGDLRREMNRLFDWDFPHSLKSGNGPAMWSPEVDIIDEKDQIKVRADLPGLKKEDIEVNLENDILTIKGEKQEEKETRNKDYVRSERYCGAFHRSFVLPSAVDPQKVQAVYKDGVLDLTLSKKEGAKSKEIVIEVK